MTAAVAAGVGWEKVDPAGAVVADDVVMPLTVDPHARLKRPAIPCE